MRKDDYRRAVGGIRWSPEKREAIEEKLKRPVRAHSKKIAEVEKLMKEPRKSPPAKQPEYKRYMKEDSFMKQERRRARAYLLILAAAILLIGGTVAGVAYSAKKKGNHSVPDNIIEQSSLTDEQKQNAVISPKLTDQQDSPYCHKYAETNNGFFYLYDETKIRPVTKNGETWNEPYTIQSLKYCDFASGKSVFVCSKPNCLHDGNEFCTATTENYELLSDPVWLDGYVYAIALNKIELLNNPENCTTFPTVLLRYAPDGTEITEVAQLNNSEFQTWAYAELIAHRGQLWMTCAYIQYKEIKDDKMEVISTEDHGKWEMYCYEPAAGKLTALSSTGDWQKDYRPYVIGLYPEGGKLRGYGDYVYFHKYKEDWRDSVKGSGVYRIDCRTGLIEQVAKIKSEKSFDYAMIGNKIYYVFDKNTYNPTQITSAGVLTVYDTATGEETEVMSLFALAQEQQNWITAEDLGNGFHTNVWIEFSEIIPADGRLYLFWSINDIREDFDDYSFYVTEIGEDGSIRTEKKEGQPNEKLPEDFIRHYVNDNGYYYSAKKWCSPKEMTKQDILIMRSSGCWETEDGEWLDPRDLNNEDIERLKQSGFYIEDYVHYEPDELTEEIYQMAIENFGTESYSFRGKSDVVQFNGTDFYIEGGYSLFRISPRDFMDGAAPQRVLFWDYN